MAALGARSGTATGDLAGVPGTRPEPVAAHSSVDFGTAGASTARQANVVATGQAFAVQGVLPAQAGASSTRAPAVSRGSTNQSSEANGVTAAARIDETGSITVLTPGSQVQPDVARLTALAIGDGGFVASTVTQSASPGSPAQATVTLQVPDASFASALGQVRELGKVASLSTSATDVTGQYVDIQSQITALQDSRQQYLTIMTKATTIGGILAVQSQLDSLQSQLQQLQGQLQLLGSETTYATLAVTLSQKVVTPPPPRPQSGFAMAWHSAVSGFVAGCEGVVRVAGPLFFVLLLLGAAYLVARFSWRLYRRRGTSPGPPSPAPPSPGPPSPEASELSGPEPQTS